MSELSLLGFMLENHKAGGLSEDTSKQLEILFNEYKLVRPEGICSIIDVDTGFLGSISIYNSSSIELDEDLKYAGRSYDYVSIEVTSVRTILWTDYSNEEPYNRQSGLYANGASFMYLGKPIKETPEYREFDVKKDRIYSLSTGVWGFSYNEYYGSVKFGLCIKTELVDEFIDKFKTIVGK